MMDDERALAFAQDWAAAWNRRDVEAVLAYVHETVVFTSPLAQQIGFADDGMVRGKAALRRYWTAALAHSPDLRLEVTSVYRGADTLVIAFRNQHGADRAEVLVFNHGRVVAGHGVVAAT